MKSLETESRGPQQPSPEVKDVRCRLLRAAADLFAEHGYERTSIREITRLAHCNVASINYYFGGKEQIYTEVFRQRLQPVTQRRLAVIRQLMEKRKNSLGLRELLGAFANAFIEPLMEFDHTRGRQMMLLMMREMIDPHLPVGMLLNEVVAPLEELMLQALRQVCPGIPDRQARLSLHSVMGQLLHMLKLQRLFFDPRLSGRDLMVDLETMVEHIVEFSVGGFQAYRKKFAPPRGTGKEGKAGRTGGSDDGN